MANIQNKNNARLILERLNANVTACILQPIHYWAKIQSARTDRDEITKIYDRLFKKKEQEKPTKINRWV